MTKAPHHLHFAVLAIDVAAFRIHEGQLEVLFIPAAPDIFKGKECLPGGLINPEETADEAAIRHLHDKGGIEKVYLEQLYTFSSIDRDPRGRVVSVAHLALIPGDYVPKTKHEVAARWVPLDEVKKGLAYDHDEIVAVALERLRARVGYTTIIQHLLPREFSLTELQQAYELVLAHSLDKRNFRKKILALELVTPTGEKRVQGASRPAELYRFTEKRVRTINVL